MQRFGKPQRQRPAQGDSGDGIRDHQGGDGIPAFPSAGTERGKWGMDADQPGMELEADARSRKLSKKRKSALTGPERVPSQGPKRPLGVREPPRRPNRPRNRPTLSRDLARSRVASAGISAKAPIHANSGSSPTDSWPAPAEVRRLSAPARSCPGAARDRADRKDAFIIDWLLDAELQRRAQIWLNKGEAHHALKKRLAYRPSGRNPRPHHRRTYQSRLATEVALASMCA